MGAVAGLFGFGWLGMMFRLAVAGVVFAAMFSCCGIGTDETGEVQAGTISLAVESSSTVRCTFGKFSPSVSAEDAVIQIENEYGTNAYSYESTSTCWVCDVDTTGTGTTLFFMDLALNGNLDNGDFFIFDTPDSGDYEVSVMVNSEIVCKETIFISSESSEVQAGSITLSMISSSIVECRFGKFSPSVSAEAVTISIEYDYETNTYWHESTSESWICDYDATGTGTTLSFIDLADDGNLNSGDYFTFETPNLGDYKVSVIIDSTIVCSATISV